MTPTPPSLADKIWNPFTWRLREIAALEGQLEHVQRCRELHEELVFAEALEAARGVRHLSIVHGDPATLPEAQHLDAFLAVVDDLIATAPWRRLRGDEDHLIIAVGGDDADEHIARVAEAAESWNPGRWRITPGARPDLSGSA